MHQSYQVCIQIPDTQQLNWNILEQTPILVIELEPIIIHSMCCIKYV